MFLTVSSYHRPGRLSSRLHSDVDRMGRTVALNANALVRSTVKTCLMLKVMLGLSWELTVLTCIEMPLLAVVQNKYITLTKVCVRKLLPGSPEQSTLENSRWTVNFSVNFQDVKFTFHHKGFVWLVAILFYFSFFVFVCFWSLETSLFVHWGKSRIIRSRQNVKQKNSHYLQLKRELKGHKLYTLKLVCPSLGNICD